MTIAEEVATRFGNNGFTYEDLAGRSLDDVCRMDYGADVHRDRYFTRYVFLDESAILDSKEWGVWDVEGSPWYWAGI